VANDSIAAPAVEVHAMFAVVKGKVRIGIVASAGPAAGTEEPDVVVSHLDTDFGVGGSAGSTAGSTAVQVV